jgi:methylaspartate mutase epsilon subunit
MGVFPYNYDIANGLIATSAQLGVMLGADKIVTKTKEEARGIPSVKNNSDAVRLVRYVIDHAMETVLNKDEMIEVEEDRIYQQVKSVMNVIFNLDTSSFRDSISLAVSSGYIDIPFSNSKKYTKGRKKFTR